MLKKILILLAAVVALLWAALQFDGVQNTLMANIIAQRLGQQPTYLFTHDALRVVVCGSTSPFPSTKRAGPCVAVFAGGKFYIVDTGNRSWNNLALAQVPAQKLGAVFLTHFHSDHIAELGEYNMQSWVGGRSEQLKVYCGPGIKPLVDGFNQAYQYDRHYRTAHHGQAIMPADTGLMQAVEVPERDQAQLIFEDGPLKITAFNVQHAPIKPALGYRFDYGDRSVVVSGDTVVSDSLITAAQNVDVLLHEAQANHMVQMIASRATEIGNASLAKVMHDIMDYHSTAVQAAEVANKAQAKLLVMYHLTPPPPNKIAEKIFLRGVADVRDAGVELAVDGLLLELPLNSTAIVQSQL